jgi:hypothetical protein
MYLGLKTVIVWTNVCYAITEKVRGAVALRWFAWRS